ncbi:MAG TPA: radical SAM protein, partial [Anaerolineales bacterium]
QPYYLPALQCTPDHRLYATDNPIHPPKLTRAAELTQEHYLAIPRHYSFSSPQTIHVAEILSGHTTEYRTPWKISADEVQAIMQETSAGRSSREIGMRLGKHPAYIRHIRSKFRRGTINASRIGTLVMEGESVRFPNEHRPGIPDSIQIDEKVARLFGLYCAEGSVVRSKTRPNSLVINFSFAPDETHYAEEVQQLLKHAFKLEACLVRRETTLAVAATKASAGLLLKALAGGRASEKRVPKYFYDAPEPVVRAFLDALVDGDGHRYAQGKVSFTTVSRDLAYGAAWLALKLGYVPSLSDSSMSSRGTVQGREVNRSAHQYSVVWYENNSTSRKISESEDYHLIPLRNVQRLEYDGDVFNMEVQSEHNYLAGFFLVSNCQNWLTSQAMRDPASDAAAQFVKRMTPERMVQLARQTKASVVVSSYNEPLITSEWAVEIFKAARDAGLMCAYVSNGNNTPEVIDYIRPYISAYKVDLKSMQDKNYRKLGGVLQNTLDGIQRARQAGLWVEIVTLIIPGFNDSNDELWDAARFLAGISTDIPWHVTAFHKDYKMTDPDNTDARTLLRAAEIGREAGLKYVYAGNLPGQVEEHEDTFCPNCQARLIRRRGYVITEYRLNAQGQCPQCGRAVPGLWPSDPSAVGLNGVGMPLPVL